MKSFSFGTVYLDDKVLKSIDKIEHSSFLDSYSPPTKLSKLGTMTSVINGAAFPGPQWGVSFIQPAPFVSAQSLPQPSCTVSGPQNPAFISRRSTAVPASTQSPVAYYSQPPGNPFQNALQTIADVSLSVPLNINSNQKIDTSNHYHIFVGDLAPEVENKELYDAFANFGLVTECKIIKDMHTQKPKGYGFVAYATKEEAELAIQRMNGQIIGTRPIRTGWAVRKPSSSQPKDQRPLNYSEVANASSASNCTVYVGGITKGLCEEALRSSFKEFGEILEVRVFKEKGYSFIRFDTHEGATKAIITMHGKNVAGQPCKCSWGKESSDSTLPTIGNLLASLSKQVVAANQLSYINALAVSNGGSEWSANSASGSSSVGSGLSSASAPPGISFLNAANGTTAGSSTGLGHQRALAFSQPALTESPYALSAMNNSRSINFLTTNGNLPGSITLTTDPSAPQSAGIPPQIPYNPNDLCNGILTPGRLINLNGTASTSGSNPAIVQAASAVTLATLLSNGHAQGPGIIPQPTHESLFTPHIGLAQAHLAGTNPFSAPPQTHPEYIAATNFTQHQLAIHSA